jgi:hypothetical protein
MSYRVARPLPLQLALSVSVKASAGRVAGGASGLGSCRLKAPPWSLTMHRRSQSRSRAALDYASADEFLRCGDLNRQSGLIFDHHMAHVTGLELASRLRAGGGSRPVPLVTGAPPPAIAAQAAELGITNVLEACRPKRRHGSLLGPKRNEPPLRQRRMSLVRSSSGTSASDRRLPESGSTESPLTPSGGSRSGRPN